MQKRVLFGIFRAVPQIELEVGPAEGPCSDRMNTPQTVAPKALLWLYMLPNTGCSTRNSRMSHPACGMGWMIYLTALSHISQRGSRCTTWTTTENIFPLFSGSIVGSVDVMLWLLNRDADANGRNHYGSTSLHRAANNNHILCSMGWTRVP
jgi:hypothetical protein